MPLEDLADDVAKEARREHGDPDKPVIHEVGWNNFMRVYKQTAMQDRRSIPPHDKPALNQGKMLGVEMWMTVSDICWDIREVNLRKGTQAYYDYEKACPHCYSVLKLTYEYNQCWVHNCPNCGLPVIGTKEYDGGTMGQGLKWD